MINKKRLVRLTQKLIRINSENPPGNEAKIAAFVKGYFMRQGLTTKVYEFKKFRPNIVVSLEGKNKKYSLLITPHLDTVPAGKNWRYPPFSGKIYRDKIYGLGATDCKCNLAVAMEAISSLIEDKNILDYNLVFAATADEECGSGLGLIPLLDRRILAPSAALVLDADEFDIIVAQKGLLHFKVKLEGKKAHGAYPWRGVNAIDISVKILQDLKSLKLTHSKNSYLKPPTLNIGTIKGGDKVNIVADWCEFELDYRFLPGMAAGDFLKKVKTIIKKYTRKFKIEIESIEKPYIIDKAHRLVNYFSKATRKFNIEPRVKGSEGATTITFFQNKNIPAIASGFGSSACAHTLNEYVEIDNLYKGAKVLETFLKIYHFI